MKHLLAAALISCLPLACVFAYPELDMHQRLNQPERAIHEEADPANEQACFSMGRMIVEYASGEAGVGRMGFRIVDPLGREIGYDPRTSKGWQDMPFSEAYFDCDENEATGEMTSCKAHIEICGPISGRYRIELSSAQIAKYHINVSAASQRSRTESGYQGTVSRADFEGALREQDSAVLLLQYSRHSGTQIKLARSDQPLADK
jgi:hypothetical protein